MSGLMSITATVIDAEGNKREVTTNTYDIYKAEQLLGELKLMGGKPAFADMAALIWSAARRQGFAGDDFDAWLQEVELDLSGLEDEDPKDD